MPVDSLKYKRQINENRIKHTRTSIILYETIVLRFEVLYATAQEHDDNERALFRVYWKKTQPLEDVEFVTSTLHVDD